MASDVHIGEHGNIEHKLYQELCELSVLPKLHYSVFV